MSLDFDFAEGDAIVVTGAASGIGRATALRAAEAGLAVSAWDLDETGLEETAAAIRSRGGTVRSWVADISDEPTVRAGLADAAAHLGWPRYLHNNAGPASSSGIPFDKALEICLGGVRTVTQSWAEGLDRPGASMVITASVAGNLIGTESDWYSIAKAGLMGYVRHLASQQADRFRSNGVGPGMTDTPRLKGFSESATGQRVLQRIPLHRMAEPDDIAYSVLFLLSPLASYVNGVFLPVDGGWTVTQ